MTIGEAHFDVKYVYLFAESETAQFSPEVRAFSMVNRTCLKYRHDRYS